MHARRKTLLFLFPFVLVFPMLILVGRAESDKAGETDTPANEPTETDLREELADIQYYVTCQGGTEPAFQNAYWDNKKPGIYVDVISGKPLFSSTDKYQSGSGWPSFTRPLEEDEIEEKVDRTLGMARTEVRTRTSDAHLGHVFSDGPKPSGLRYCVNSASLRFIPVAKLKDEGYGEYLKLFEDEKG